MISGRRRLEDVTAAFTTASQNLQPGQLVKDDFFTLFESVGALEIMDAKMDSGYVPPGDTFEPDFNPCSGLEATEVLWIIDQLLCLEVTWLDGYPLAQTLYTSLHIDRLLSPDKVHESSLFMEAKPRVPETASEKLVHAILRPYCVALVKCCQLTLHLVQSQTYWEEEDFVTHLFGRELLPKTGSIAAANELAVAIDMLFDWDLANELRQALIARLRFRMDLMQALSEDARIWDTIRSHIEDIATSHALARAVPEAFSEKVQRRLATSTPPRPMIEIPFDVACQKWTTLCEDMLAVFSLTTSEIIQSPQSLQRATWAFAGRGQPSTLARAQMQYRLFNEQAVAGEIFHFDLMLVDIADLVLAGDSLIDPENFNVELPSDPRHICGRILSAFMEKAIEEYLNLYRLVCQNRCRIRRTLLQALPILRGLEVEGEEADRELRKHAASLSVRMKGTQSHRMEEFSPLSSWTYFHRLRVTAWTIQLGFELEIYLPHELSRMYKFLSWVSQRLSDHLQHITSFVKDRQRTLRNGAQRTACATSLHFLASLNDTAKATTHLAEALHRLCHITSRIQLTSPPRDEATFASRTGLYEARMKPYLSVSTPDIPSLEVFEHAEQALGQLSIDACLDAVAEDVKQAKLSLATLKEYTPEQAKFIGTEVEWKREIKQMETTCVAIAVTGSQLRRLRAKVERDDLRGLVLCSFERKYHVWWAIPQLKEMAV